jgi:ssDNA-binding replication factor A large subunit
MEEGSETVWTKIASLRPNMRFVNVEFIVIEKKSGRTTRDGNTVFNCIVSDETGKVDASFWDDVGRLVEEGDILKLEGGLTVLFRGKLQLSSGKRGTIRRNGRYLFPYNDHVDASKPEWIEDPQNPRNYMLKPPDYHDPIPM